LKGELKSGPLFSKEGNGEITKKNVSLLQLAPSPLAGEGGGEGGCPIPALSPENRRILEMRMALIRLKDLTDGKAILEIYGAGKEDIEILAELEDEMRRPGRDAE